MMKKLIGYFGLVILLTGITSAQTTNIIYSDANDGFLEARDTLPPVGEWPQVHPDTFGGENGWKANVGEWWGSGITTIVLPFQLPDLGATSNPFETANLGVNLIQLGEATATSIDLYAIRIDAAPEISTNDWYNGSTVDPSATLIQSGFLTPASAIGPINTDAAADTALVDYLNLAYADGVNTGKYVFLRLSWTLDALASGWDAYTITTRNAGQEAEWPTITTTLVETDNDKDGLPNIWELSFGLDPNDDGSIDPNNGAAGDPDEDLVTNIDELALGTSPIDDDSDDDDLTDGEEVVLTTDPLDADSDDDRLSDGDEVNMHGTNPLTAQSDGDGEPDGIEILQGTNPTNTLSSSAAYGLVVMDGTLDSYYGDAVSTQTVNASWNDNGNELNAAYTYVQDGKLFLMLTGNLEDNWNKFEIFIDSTDAVTTNVLELPGNDGADFMNGLTFDDGFEPDYYLNVRRGFGQFFNIDMTQIGTTNVSEHGNVFNNYAEGFAKTGVGPANASPIYVAYDNSNTNGVVQGNDAADPAAALSATQGFEMSVALSDIGNPAIVRVAVILNGASHDWISNQLLGGLVPDPVQDALGRDGMGGDAGGTLTNDLSAIDFNDFAGDQFFSINVPLPIPEIMTAEMAGGNTQMQLGVSGLAVRGIYVVQDTEDIANEVFSDVPGSEFTADSTEMVIDVPADTDVKFYQVVAP